MLSDIFPTGYHGAFTAGVGPGSSVYVAGAGPVGLACAASAQLLGAAVVIVGDMIPERLEQARSFGCETVDLRRDASLGQQIEQIMGEPLVDSAVDCVGFEARGHGEGAEEAPATVLNDAMTITRGGRQNRHPRTLRDGRPRRSRRGRTRGSARHPHRLGLGEVAHVYDRSVPGDELQPRADGWRF